MNLNEDRKMVQKAVDDAFSFLEADPALAKRIMERSKKKKRRLSKKNVALIAAVALVLLGSVALALSQVPGIKAFLGNIIGGWAVKEEEAATSTIKEYSGAWLNITPIEAYWAEDGLSVVLKAEAADGDKAVVYESEKGLPAEKYGERNKYIEINGRVVPLDEWREGREVIVSSYFAGEGWTWYRRDKDGLYVIVNIWNYDAEKLQKGCDIDIQVFCKNLQTGETEESSLVLSLPPMTMQKGRSL